MDDEGGLRENDPYREMRESEQRSVRPDFSGRGEWPSGAVYRKNGDYYDKNDKKLKNRSRRNAAKDSLKSAEDGAKDNGLDQPEDSLIGNRQNESSARGFYSGGRGGLFAKSKNKNGKQKGKGLLKKGGPIGAIFAIIVGVGGLMGGMQNFMPIAIEELIIEKFNSIGISSTMASDAWLDVQLNQGVRVGNLTTGESSENLFAFSEYQVKQFEGQGLKVISGVGNLTQITTILYQKDDQWIPVVGSDILKYNGYTEEDLINAIKGASGLENIGKPVSPKEAMADPNFKTPYTTASKSWRGGASGWFDNIMEDITQAKLNTTRNRWAKWAASGLKKMEKDFKKTAKVQTEINDMGLDAEEEVESVDDEGNKTTIKKEIKSVGVENEGGVIKNETLGSTSMNGAKSLEKIKDVLNSKALKAAATASTVICGGIKGLITIYSIVGAQQKLQFLNLISGFLEAVDKVKAGYGSSSPVGDYATNLSTKADTVDDDGNVVAENKTAMESAGMAWLFGGAGAVIGQGDQSVRNVNFESIMSNISWLTSDIKFTTSVYKNCSYVKVGAATVSLATTILTLGTAESIKDIIVKPTVKLFIKWGLKTALSIIIPIAAKNYARMLLNDVATDWFGEDLGNAIMSGANQYLGGNGSSGGQGPGTKNKVIAYLGERDNVIAEEAKYQRSIRSPFDINSRHTFLGSMAYAMVPLAYSNGIMANITSATSLLSSSVTTIFPTANAISEQSVMGSMGSCDLLESVGSIGDAFCNPYIITDVGTIDTSPVAVNNIVHDMISDNVVATNGVYENVGSSNFNSDGSIKDGSNLAKYVTFCGQRVSQYGLYDGNITAQLTGENSTFSSIINFVPGLNDIQDIKEGTIESDNQRYITGEACVASDDGYWNENKWYQRYAENERLLENMNPGYTSTVTAYLNKHYEENPIDQSYEGTLARFTGMSVEEVENALALIEYYEFLNNYEPSERYAFGAPVIEVEEGPKFDNENQVAGNMWGVLVNMISYADVRNRTFAV